MTLNVCQAGHTFHESKVVDTEYGQLVVYDWERYRGFAGYCPGQDDVSMSLDLYGDWERPDIARMRAILTEKPGWVMDFGAHIGWFAIQALTLGCNVIAYDADEENIRLLELNRDLRIPPDGPTLLIYTGWVSENSPVYQGLDGVRFLKSDVEGAEDRVIDVTRWLWQAGRIDHALLEISPVFKPYYPALVDELRGYGYEAYIIKDEGDWKITGADVVFPQENVHFSRL